MVVYDYIYSKKILDGKYYLWTMTCPLSTMVVVAITNNEGHAAMYYYI